MRFFVLVLLLAAFAVGWYVLAGGNSRELYMSPLVKEHMDALIAETNKELDRLQPACINLNGPLPRPPIWRHLPCDACPALASAGLLELKEGRYHLLPAGLPYARNPNKAGAQLCFAEVKVHQVVASLNPLHDVSSSLISMQYIPELISPTPFLFTEEARSLNLPEPRRAADDADRWVSDPQIITFNFNRHMPEQGFFPNRGARYGRYAVLQENSPWH